MKAKFGVPIVLMIALSLFLSGCGAPATALAPTPTPGWQELADWKAFTGKTVQTFSVSANEWYLWFGTGHPEGYIGGPITVPRFLIQMPGVTTKINVAIVDTATQEVVAQRYIEGDGLDFLEVNRPGDYRVEFDAAGTWYAGVIGLQ